MLQFPILIYISSKWLFWWKLFHGVGEGNGNPLQCSCLENPRDGGAWWAAVYGVAQSRTWLKRLSSSSSSFHGVARFGHNLATKPPLPYNFICTMKVKVKMLVAQSCSTFCDPLDWTVARQAPLSMEFSRQEYWSGLPVLLQQIFPTQGSNLDLLHFRQILYCLSHKGSPYVLRTTKSCPYVLWTTLNKYL